MLSDELRALLNAEPPHPVQPKHLPAVDPSLATEIMPAPPPASYVFHPPNSHHRRPPTVLSYLPMLDPGSTYVNSLSLALSDGGTITPAGADDDSGRKKRWAKSHKTLVSSLSIVNFSLLCAYPFVSRWLSVSYCQLSPVLPQRSLEGPLREMLLPLNQPRIIPDRLLSNLEKGGASRLELQLEPVGRFLPPTELASLWPQMRSLPHDVVPERSSLLSQSLPLPSRSLRQTQAYLPSKIW